MGMGINIGCKCHNATAREFMLGVGMGFPYVYQETVKDIKAGKYGEEAKNIMTTIPYAAVDLVTTLYYCDKCGHIDEDEPMDIYIPKDVEKVKKQPVGRWTAADPLENNTILNEEIGELSYWTPPSEFEDDNRPEYVLVKKGSHPCPKCKNEMRAIDEEELEKIKCPKCGSNYVIFPGVLWD